MLKKERGSILQSGREISRQELDEIQETIGVFPRYYEGISYKSANWQYLGMTTGDGLVRKGRTYTTTSKKIFVKPLVKDWQSLLCSEQLEGRVDK